MNANLLRASAVYLGLAATASLLLLDLPGVGFSESYIAGFVVGMLLWRAYPVRYAQLTGAVVQLWLGTLGVLFWPSFVDAGLAPAGVILVSLHFAFAVLQVVAAVPAGARTLRPT